MKRKTSNVQSSASPAAGAAPATSGQPPKPTSGPSAQPTEPNYPVKIKGTMTQLDAEGNCEFRAQQSTGEPAQEVIESCGQSKLYRTTGKKKQQMVAHLSVPADTADPVASMARQFNQLTAGMQARKRPEPKGEMLLNERDARVILSQKERKLYVELTFDLKEKPNITYELPRLMAQLSTCLFTNREKVANATK